MLLRSLITYSPEMRYTTRQAIESDYFIEEIPENAPYIPSAFLKKATNDIELLSDQEVAKCFNV